MVDKEEPKVLVVGSGVNETLKKIIPPLTSQGNLSVGKKEDLPNAEQLKIKKIILPPIGTRFMINGKEYKVTYINEGKKRLSAVPCLGQY